MSDFFISLALLGAMSMSNSYLPFWMTTNQFGLMPERNGGLALLQVQSEFDESRIFQWKWGSSFAVNSFDNPLAPGSSTVHPMVDQLYGSLMWKVFNIDIGMKHRVNEFLGASERLGSLSVTGGHLVESGNARSMPGYLISMKPVAVPFTSGRLFLSGAYGDYTTTDNRYVKGALVHRTRIGFHLEPWERLSLSVTLDHYAIWGGTHPDPEKPQVIVNLANYFRVITGSHAGSDGTLGDQINIIGDQGGSEIFKLEYQGDGWTFTAQHDIPYNDGSGMGFQNFPDGVNTLHFGWTDKNRWICDILYEHQYTMYQSGPFNEEEFDDEGHNINPPGVPTTGGDNYFSNSYYCSGWSHYGHMICDPLILPWGIHNATWTSATIVENIENNRLKSHHFAIGGKLLRKYPYKLMLTYSDNYGNYHAPYLGEWQWGHEWGTVNETGLKQFSAAFVGEVNLCRSAVQAGRGSTSSGRSDSSTGRFSSRNGRLIAIYGLYLDRGELYSDSIGCTLGLRYTIGR